MKKILSFLLLGLLLSIGYAWGAELELSLNNLYQNGTKVTAKTVIATSGGSLTFTDEDEMFTVLLTRNSGNQPGFYTSSGYFRFYSSDVVKISAANGLTITKIVITSNGSSFSLSAMEGLDTSKKTWTGEASEVSFTGAGTNKWDKLTITYSTATPAYTITAQSNNISYGTVSLSGSIITGAPQDGYRYASPAYTVSPENSATVTQNGNSFVVTPSANTTVTINFEAIPNHTATFSVNGATTNQAFAEGADIDFPSVPEDIYGKKFVGWVTAAIDGTTDETPAFVTSATMGNSDITYYAVFANQTQSYSDTEEEMTQTLQYDSWTYSGSTTDKTSYRLFHTNSYIESSAFDLSLLKKVKVYGGTFGGGDYNSLTIGDGTNVWKNVTVSGSSQTAANTYTGGTELSGTKPLRIICNSGTASSTGVRISKVEIFTKKVITNYTNYCTTVVLTYSVTYDANGASSGSVPTDETEYSPNASVTVLGNTGNLVKNSYAFGGWNTQADGEGTTYVANATFNITSNTTLYAKWNVKTITGLSYTGTLSKTEYYDGDDFDPTGLTVKATFDDESVEIVTEDVVWTPTPLTKGTTSVTGTYMEQTVTINDLTVTAAPGSEENPYTVAQARAAINAGTGTTNVYATGIVSAIITAYNSDNDNITFDIIDEGKSETLRAYRCSGDDAADVLVGDIVIVSGNLTKYNSIYEFAQGCTLNYLEHPIVPVINASNPNKLAYNATSGEFSYTITNPTEATLQATSEADWISNIIVTSDKVTFTTTVNEGASERNATITLAYSGAANKAITITQAAPDYANLPFSFNSGRANIETTNGLTQDGLGTDYSSSPKLKFDGTGDYVVLKINEAPSLLTFDIKGNSFSDGTFTVQTSTDGNTYTTLETYTELGDTQSEAFNLASTVRYIKWIYTTKDNGNVALGNIFVGKGDVLTLAQGTNGYSTYAADFDYTVSGATKIYTAAVSTTDANYVILSDVAKNTVIPANAGIIINGNEGDKVIIKESGASASELANNSLVGVVEELNPFTVANAYILATNVDGDGETKFHLYTGTTFPAHKAYLPVDNGSNAPLRIMFAENNTTDINAIEASEKAVKFFENGKLFILRDGVVYDATGRVVR